MSVENMTEVSLFLFAAAGILAAVAAVMFFSFNIPKCLRMVSGRFFVRGQKSSRGGKRQPQKPRTEEMPRSGETLFLDVDMAEGTQLLDGDLEIVQDIAYKDGGARL